MVKGYTTFLLYEDSIIYKSSLNDICFSGFGLTKVGQGVYLNTDGSLRMMEFLTSYPLWIVESNIKIAPTLS